MSSTVRRVPPGLVIECWGRILGESRSKLEAERSLKLSVDSRSRRRAELGATADDTFALVAGYTPSNVLLVSETVDLASLCEKTLPG
jgi:hypothetical protein